MSSLASINIKFRADLSGFSSEMQNSLRTIDAFGQKMQKLGQSMSLYITAPVLAAGAAAIKFASDYEESVNKVDVAFGPAAESVKKFASTTLETFGIAEGSALDMAASFGDMGTSMGLSTAKAGKMSTALVGLAGDLASFKNIGVDIATTALTAVYTGETESLKKLGIVLTEVNLQEFALSQGIKKKIKDLTQAEKVQLRYNYILSVTKNAQGDFARTQDDAANQARIFTESLKQVGQQLGAVILPIFTKVISVVNEKIKGFLALSDATKTTIVVVAGLAAVVGPLILAIGAVASIIPTVVAGFAILSGAIVPIVAGMVLLGGLFLLLGNNSKKAAEGIKELSAVQLQSQKINDDATAAVVSQKAELQSLIDVAKNEAKSKKERLEAIRAINKISPEFLGNLNLENIGTDKARIAVEKYNIALLQGAKARAAQKILQDLYEKQIELQLQREKGEVSLNKARESATKADGAGAAAQKKYNDLLNDKSGALKSLQKQQDLAITTEINSAAKIYEDGKKYIDLLQETGTATAGVANEAAKLKKELPKSGSIDFYEAQITALQKLQKGFSFTSAAYQKYGNDIIEVQKKIDAISGDKKQNFTFAFKDQLPANGIDDKIKAPDVSKIDFSEGIQEAGYNIEDLTSKMEYLKEVGESVGASVSDSFSSLSSNIIGSLGLAKDGFQGFVGGLLQTITKLIAMMLASSISQSIAGATASGVATGPAAIFTTPAFIATAVGGVLAAFAAIPKFETGGIVGGSSMYGDKILARVNSGELILNQNQQRNLYGQMGGGSSDTIIPNIKIQGSDLLVVFDRASKKKNRLG